MHEEADRIGRISASSRNVIIACQRRTLQPSQPVYFVGSSSRFGS